MGSKFLLAEVKKFKFNVHLLLSYFVEVGMREGLHRGQPLFWVVYE